MSRKHTYAHQLVIHHFPIKAHAAVAQCGSTYFQCSIGPAGIRRVKREGDLATPAGIWPLRYVLYRPDRMSPPRTGLPVYPISPDGAWCDDPLSPDYNKPVDLPYSFSHEELWRSDHLYDLVVVIGHNDDPPVRGHGSAVFLHLRRPDGGATHGCLAFSRRDLVFLLSRCNSQTCVVIGK